MKNWSIWSRSRKPSSISKAAQNLHVTISAVSQSISSLEEEWGVAVLKRQRTGAVPTAEGAVIIKKAAELLQKYEELKEAAQGYSELVQGRLRIATIPGPMLLLEQAVLDFKRKYPQVKIEIVEQGSQDIIDDVLNDKTDLGFIILYKNWLIEHLGLDYDPLLKVKMVAATSIHSPLAFQKTITPEELKRQNVVLYNDDYVKWFMDDFQKKYGLSRYRIHHEQPRIDQPRLPHPFGGYGRAQLFVHFRTDLRHRYPGF